MADPWYDGPIWQGFKWSPTNPKGHSGIDIGMPIGTPLTALLPGKIISFGMEPWAGQMNLQHDWPGIGPIVVSYLHGSAFPAGLSVGGFVQPGDVVMLSGQPPPGGQYGSGAHCHFEVSKGTQPPYMGHNGPSNPIDGTFLLDYAKQTNGGVSGNGGGTDPFSNPLGIGGGGFSLAGLLGLPSFSLGTGAITRAPLSPGFLGIVEGIDEIEELVAFDSSNILGWAHQDLEAITFRSLVIGVGLLLVVLVVFNVVSSQLDTAVDTAKEVLPLALSAGV